MRGYSRAIGSLTFMSISAFAQTSAAVGTMRAPNASYCASSNPLPSPAVCSISTVCPLLTRASAPPGVSATRFSFVLISLGTPTIMSVLSVFARPETDRYLVVRIEVLGRKRGNVIECYSIDAPDHLVNREVRLVVQRGACQAVEAAARAFERQNDLPLYLALHVAQLLVR